jgi:hypothetical protein
MIRWPSDEQVDRAAEFVAKVAHIPDLDKGWVILPADTLDRVLAWEEDETAWGPRHEVCVKVPSRRERPSHLRPDGVRSELTLRFYAREAVIRALHTRQGELAVWLDQARSEPPDEESIREFGELLYEGVAS